MPHVNAYYLERVVIVCILRPWLISELKLMTVVMVQLPGLNSKLGVCAQDDSLVLDPQATTYTLIVYIGHFLMYVCTYLIVNLDCNLLHQCPCIYKHH